jgi:hypothetical protein
MGWQDDAVVAPPKQQMQGAWANDPVVQPAPQQAQQQPEQPQQENTWGNAIKNVGEAGLNFATGMVGGIAGDIAGLGATAYDITANAVMHPFSGAEPGAYADPAAVRERVASSLTYQPENPNSLSSKIVQTPGRVIQGAGEFLGDPLEKAGFPNAAHVARAVPLAAASALGVKAARGPTFDARSMGGPASMAVPRTVPGTPAPPKPEPTPEQVSIKNATDIGIKLPPSAVGNKAGNVVEGLSGRAPLARTLSMENAKAVDAAAAKAVGIEGKPVNRASIGVERARANKAYDSIAKTGTRKVSDEFRKEVSEIDDRSGGGSFADDAPPQVEALKNAYAKQQKFDAADAVARIRKLRKDAGLNFKTRDPDKAAIAHVQQKIADALDAELERHADSIGQPQLAADYKAARVQLAKLRTVEDALAGNSVSARKIWQQWKRGAPLSGELLAIARAFDSFPNVLQDANKIAGTHPFSVVDGLVAGAGATAGITGNPALLATVVARPAARAYLASNRYQRNNVRPKGAAPKEAKPRVAPPAVAAPVPQERKAR